MPGPFPGMDPYLESGDLWQGFHNRFMTYACDALQPRLPAGYIATLEMRIFVGRGEPEDGAGERIPDVEVLRTGRHAGGAAVAEPGAPVGLAGYWIEDLPVERREAYVNIRALEGSRLVTSIELLSPSNKRSGQGRREYVRKQEEMQDAGVSLVEIDLLRGGQHTVAVPEGLLAGLPPYDYLACVWRAYRPWGFQVLPWALREPLPEVPIPLAAEDEEPRLDLQALLEECYEKGRYRELLSYRGEPSPALRSDDAAWARELLKTAGLREASGA
jgi:hypothetical protein